MLDFSWDAFAFAVVNFLILVGVLYRFLHKPILEVLANRQASIQALRDEAAAAHSEARERLKEYDRQLAAVRDERDQMLSEAHTTAQQAADALLEEAKTQAKREAERLKTAFERDRDEALDAFRGEVVGTAIDLVRTVLAAAEAPELDACLQRGVISSLEALAGDDAPETKADVPVCVKSAAALDDETRAALTAAIAGVAGEDAEILFQEDADLVAGARVEFADRAVDATLKSVLDEMSAALAKDASEETAA